MLIPMNPGAGEPIFLVQCADSKYLAVHDPDGKWKSFYDGSELPPVTKVIAPVPFELVLPFLSGAQGSGLRPPPPT